MQGGDGGEGGEMGSVSHATKILKKSWQGKKMMKIWYLFLQVSSISVKINKCKRTLMQT